MKNGDTLEIVSRGLEEVGIIEDYEDFHQFVKNKGAEKKLRIGTYKLSSNLDYDTILSILMKLNIE